MGLFSRLFGGGSDDTAWIEAEALARALAGAHPPLVVDVRGPEEFSGALGHIKGAENVPLPRLQGQIARLVRQDRPLVLVCHTARRSGMAAAQLRAAGAKQVAVLRGGMAKWHASGLG